jgi:glycerol-3-phosphate acyltransferase PlsX
VLQLLRQAFTASLQAKLGYLLARAELERLREMVDPRRYNGAVMVGLNGVVVKSHGGTDAQGFAHAVDVAMDMVIHRFNDRIREALGRIELQPGGNPEQPRSPANGHAPGHGGKLDQDVTAGRNGKTEVGSKDGPAGGGNGQRLAAAR